MKFLLESLQMVLEPIRSCLYALITTDSKLVIGEVVVTSKWNVFKSFVVNTTSN